VHEVEGIQFSLGFLSPLKSGGLAAAARSDHRRPVGQLILQIPETGIGYAYVRTLIGQPRPAMPAIWRSGVRFTPP
jgi:hypothetical protein